MLVLSRKVGQSLVIADGVVVTVSEIGADYVRLTVESSNEPEIRRRYPQAQAYSREPATGQNGAADQNGKARPVVVTISLHHAAVLDRLRRQITDDEGTLASRDETLASLLDMVAEGDDLFATRLTGR
jgi:carbon storage regulator CsrA